MSSETTAVDPENGQAEDPEAGDEVPQVGANIRRLRKERGISIIELSEMAQVSVGMLSQIERDTANPSLKVLTKIRFALNVPLSALFADAYADEHDLPFVRRASNRPLLDFGPNRMIKELLSPSLAQNLEVMILHIPPQGNSGEQPLKFAAEKAGIVLEGELWLTVNGRTARLRKGDSFQFDSEMEHSFGNDTNKPCDVIWIIAQSVAERHL